MRSTWKTLSQDHLIMKDTTQVISNEVKKSAHLVMAHVVYISQKKTYGLLKGESPPKGNYNKLVLLEKTLNYKVLCVNTCLIKC